MTAPDIQVLTLYVRMGALVVAVVGLVFIVLQLKHLNATILGHAFSSSFAELREIQKVFIEHFELRPYFFDDMPISSDSQFYQKARSVAEMYLDAFIHMYLLRPRFPAELQNHIDLFIEDMLRSSEFLAEYVGENREFMPRDVRALALKVIETRRPTG